MIHSYRVIWPIGPYRYAGKETAPSEDGNMGVVERQEGSLPVKKDRGVCMEL